MTRNLLASLLFMVFVFMLGVSAQPELDATFAGGGKTTIVFGATASADEFFVSPNPRKSALLVKSKTLRANSMAAFQTGSSSNWEYFMIRTTTDGSASLETF